MLSVLIIVMIATALGALLGAVAARVPADDQLLVESVYALLPHTQCGQCGYAGCRPYAQALVQGGADITRCPPGGADLVKNLANLLGMDQPPQGAPQQLAAARVVSVIDEQRCIGCALCLDACPVDAIIGAKRQLHTVVATLCTGCELCVAPCPIDCISMRAANDMEPAWLRAAQSARTSAAPRIAA